MNNVFKRKQIQNRLNLEKEIGIKEKLLSQRPTDTNLKASIKMLQDQFNILIADQVATNIKYSKHNTFANANKPGRWLAYQLRKKQKVRVISKVMTKGHEIHQQDMIKKVFTEFYSQLYSTGGIKIEEIDKYLQSSSIYKLTLDQQKLMNEEITLDEISKAIKQLKTGKAPGTDGLTAIYYKSLSAEMIQPLKILFNSIMEGEQVPQSWTRAFISLIPKDEKEILELKDYRPISLLNVDYKIFAKIQANRLMQVLQHYIHEDQTGFISGRYMKNNVRQVVNLLEYLDKNNQVPSAFIFLDAEKAFDKLDWQFLNKMLDYMNFGNQFITAIKAIYPEQSAQIIVNGDLTESIDIQKGTR